jgi:hypothetical protein
VLPGRGASSRRYNAREDLREFAEAHADNWFNFVRNVFREREANRLSVIVGIHHATDWALASYSSHSSSAGLSFKVNVGSVVTADGSYDLSWESSSSDGGRVCTLEQRKQNAPQNQAIFMEAVHIYAQSFWKRVKTAISPSLRAKFGRRVSGEDMKSQGGSRSSSQPDGGANQSSTGPSATHPKSPSDGLDLTESSRRASNASSTSTSYSDLSGFNADEEAASSASDDPETDAPPDLLVSLCRCNYGSLLKLFALVIGRAKYAAGMFPVLTHGSIC